LGSQALTGLFLELTVTAPGGAAQTFERALVDRIGYAARQGVVAANVSVDPNGPPALSQVDLWTINAQPGRQDLNLLSPPERPIQALQKQLQSEAGLSPQPPDSANLFQNYLRAVTRFAGGTYLGASDFFTSQIGDTSGVVAYPDRPRLTLTAFRLKVPSGQQ